MNVKKGKVRKVFAGLFLAMAAGGAVMADAVAWPNDFWNQVSNHVAAVAPMGGQIAQGTNPAAFDSAAWGALEGAGFGTVAAPFDTVCRLFFITEPILLDTRPPNGTTFSFR